MMAQNVVLPRLIVEVFERPYFGGKRGIVWQPVRYTGNIGFQDNISSIRVFKGPNFARSADFKALFYEHIVSDRPYSTSGSRTIVTGSLQRRTTRRAVLPMSTLVMTPRPWLPMTTMS